MLADEGALKKIIVTRKSTAPGRKNDCSGGILKLPRDGLRAVVLGFGFVSRGPPAGIDSAMSSSKPESLSKSESSSRSESSSLKIEAAVCFGDFAFSCLGCGAFVSVASHRIALLQLGHGTTLPW